MSTSQSTSSPIFCSISLRRVGDDLLLESLLDPAAIQQIHHPPDPHRLVEVVVAALLHLQQDAIDVGHPQLEIAGQVLLIQTQLPLDVVERREVVLQQRQPLLHRRGVTVGQRGRHAERIEQLQLDAPGRIERRLDVALERLEPAGRPHAGIALLGPERELRADREDLRG